MTHPRGREGHFHRLLPSLAASANRTLPSASRRDGLPARRDVHFESGEEQCHAWLYLPVSRSSGPPPVLVMAHGLGAVKALRLSAFAERFQAEGYACLVFDYRNFGESEGEPRELLSLDRQREDVGSDRCDSLDVGAVLGVVGAVLEQALSLIHI